MARAADHMNPNRTRLDPFAHMLRRAVAHSCALVAAMLLVGGGAGSAYAAPTAESVARETLLDALAPALAVRGATAVVSVSPPDARRTLEPCNQMTGFLPPGARLSGKTTVGVRCINGATWQTFLTATVRVEASTWQATRALRAGETIADGDVVQAIAPLTAPDLDAAAALARTGAAANTAAATSRGLAALDGRQPAPVGRVALRAVPAGRALIAADVRDEGRINPGDAVKVIYVGNGFSVTSEGHSVGAADPGSNVVIRLAGGALVNGTLRADHLVELPR